MGFLELFLIGVGLSMDAFAVAICQGLSMTRIKWGHALTVGLYFGGFQALMPLLGWVLGSQFSGYIQQYDHWVAFILLLLIGGNMIREALSGEEDEAEDAAASAGNLVGHGVCHGPAEPAPELYADAVPPGGAGPHRGGDHLPHHQIL